MKNQNGCWEYMVR